MNVKFFLFIFISLQSINLYSSPIVELSPKLQNYFWSKYFKWLPNHFKTSHDSNKELIKRLKLNKELKSPYLIEFSKGEAIVYLSSQFMNFPEVISLCPTSLAKSYKAKQKCAQSETITWQKRDCPKKLKLQKSYYNRSEQAHCYYHKNQVFIFDHFKPHILNELELEVVKKHLNEFNLSPTLIGFEHDTNELSVYYY